jgi:hypothetical protein
LASAGTLLLWHAKAEGIAGSDWAQLLAFAATLDNRFDQLPIVAFHTNATLIPRGLNVRKNIL